MSTAMAARRASPGDGVEPPAWWRPWSDELTLLDQARATVALRREADFMTWLDERGRENQTFTQSTQPASRYDPRVESTGCSLVYRRCGEARAAQSARVVVCDCMQYGRASAILWRRKDASSVLRRVVAKSRLGRLKWPRLDGSRAARDAHLRRFTSLWDSAAGVAAKMVDEWGVKTGDCVLLCYLPGMAFMVAYWACLRLRVIAVPVYPPDPSKLEIGLKKLGLVQQSCEARLCLTETTLDQMRQALSLTHTWPTGLAWRRTDDVKPLRPSARVIDASPDDSAVAFLQYTSGSTGDPKGVMLTFENIWHNINHVYLPAQMNNLRRRGVDVETEVIVGVSWLPQFHDTGLVLCITAPFVAGYRMVNFSPLTFLRSPLLWVQAMSKYGAHWSAAPDFAYELCVRRLEEQVKGKNDVVIDLSKVVQLACGAGERCRPRQLAGFLDTFAKLGLRDDVFVPNYGLAEHVVGTCGCAAIILSKARPDLACCGEDFQVDVRIVDPYTFKDAARGEIWLSSKSCAKGYWGKPELSAETFSAQRVLPDGSLAPYLYLRTGDEGFLEDGRLYICGRLKDLIIVGGKNYFPEDIEIVAQDAAPEIRPGCVAAFAAKENSEDAEETVVCVFELRAKATAALSAEDLAALCERVRRTVGVKTGLLPERIVAIPERSIPKTTSGKVQRRNTRADLDARRLVCLYDSAGLLKVKRGGSGALWGWPRALAVATEQAADVLANLVKFAVQHEAKEAAVGGTEAAPPAAATLTAPAEGSRPPPTAEDDALLVETTAVLLAAIGTVIPGRVTAETAFYELGLSSRQMIEVLRKIEVDLDIELPPTVVFSCPSVGALAMEVARMKRGPVAVLDEEEGPSYGLSVQRESFELVVSRVACRLPGDCDDAAALHRLACSRTIAPGVVPMGRWDTAALASRISSVGAATLQAAQFGGFTRGAADFEPARFLLRPAEARALDPQQRLLLDRCAEVLGLDDSAAARARVRGANIAVAVGMMSIDAVVDVPLHKVGPHELTGNGYAAAGSRLSFLFDLHGPAVVVDTACSAALVAGHLAAKFVRDGEAESAVFGGVSLMLTPSFVHVGVAAARMSSATGRCHTFDARADGYCRAEGCAVALLERRGAAKDAAVWAGSAVRHNGQSATFTALNASSQRKLLDAVLSTRRASVVSVEAHGTGTGLGDPIELGALAAAFENGKGRVVSVSGVKACLGHTEPTAGAAGLLAALMALRGGVAHPNAALRRVNPAAAFDKRVGALVLPVDVSPHLARLRGEAVVGVSSFGYSGIIAHAALAKHTGAADDGFTDDSSDDASPQHVDAARPVVALGWSPNTTDARPRLRRRDAGEVATARDIERWRGAAHPLLQTTVSADTFARTFEYAAFADARPATLLEMALAAASVSADRGVVELSGVAFGRDAKARRVRLISCAVDSQDVSVSDATGRPLLDATIEDEAAVSGKAAVARPQSETSGADLYDEIGRLGRTECITRLWRGASSAVAQAWCGPPADSRRVVLEAIEQLVGLLMDEDSVSFASVDRVVATEHALDASRRPSACWVAVTKRPDGAFDCRVSRGGDASADALTITGATFRASPRNTNLRGPAWYEARWTALPTPLLADARPLPDRVSVVVAGLEGPTAGTARFDAAPAWADVEALSDTVIVLTSDLGHAALAPIVRAKRRVVVVCVVPRGRALDDAAALTVPRALHDAKIAFVFKASDARAAATVALALGLKCALHHAGAVYEPKLHLVEDPQAPLRRPAARVVAQATDVVVVRAAISASAGGDLELVAPSPNLSKAMAALVSSRPGARVTVVADVDQFVASSSATIVINLPLAQGHAARLVRIVATSGGPVPHDRPGTLTLVVDDLRRLEAAAQEAVCSAVSSHTASSFRAQRKTSLVLKNHVNVTLLQDEEDVVAAPAPRKKSRKGPAKTSMKSLVVSVAQRVLGVEELDTAAPLDSLGVDSLAGTELLRALSERVGRDLPATLLIQAETLDAIAAALEADEMAAAPRGGDDVEEEAPKADADFSGELWVAPASAMPVKLRVAPSTPDQELLFWMLQFDAERFTKPKFTWLPVTVVGELRGALDVEALSAAVDAVVDRHEALRCRIVRAPAALSRVAKGGDAPYASDIPEEQSFFVVDGASERPRLLVEAAPTIALARARAQAFHEVGNDCYASTPLFRVLLISANDDAEKHVLYVSTNHAASDGWSQQLVYNELVAAYNGGPKALPYPAEAPRRSYTDFLCWQDDLLARGAYDGPAAVAQRTTYLRSKRLPADWPVEVPDAVSTLFSTGALLRSDESIIVSAETARLVGAALKGDAAAFGRASLPSTVLAAYVHAIGWLQRGEASVCQYSHSGRVGHAELNLTYGQLATDMNVIFDAQKSKETYDIETLGGFVSAAHASVLEALRLAAVPYAVAYRASSERRALPPQFNWYDRYSDVREWRGLSVDEIGIDHARLKPLTFNVGALYLMGLAQADGSVALKLFFNGNVYARSTARTALRRISAFLDAVAATPPNAPLPTQEAFNA